VFTNPFAERCLIRDPGTNLEVAPVLASTTEYFTSIPLAELGDPFYRLFWRRRRNCGCRW
jgi:hypothetical protein